MRRMPAVGRAANWVWAAPPTRCGPRRRLDVGQEMGAVGDSPDAQEECRQTGTVRLVPRARIDGVTNPFEHCREVTVWALRGGELAQDRVGTGPGMRRRERLRGTDSVL